MKKTTESRLPESFDAKTKVLTESQITGLLKLHDSPMARMLYLAGGFLALFFGILGILLPILPTTPFILLAAACFARGSERFYRKLMENRITGPIIYEWLTYHSIPARVKRWVYVLITLSFVSSIFIVSEVWQKIMLVMLGSILVFCIWRIPVRKAQ
ncbi:inner membrane protein YbaN [Nitrosomonas sp. PY1]|uniref:YbaN family protein n=1 Tax=Nitrosomonas sp. PY1 TaxID=1803906 RepID=UPI001FC7FE9B|nr:YbaN family protein [Nitrosomonas sp. PY1]GKS68168.1 inner membrane protein YbaN [Nitrosomonas sp. PY1]